MGVDSLGGDSGVAEHSCAPDKGDTCRVSLSSSYSHNSSKPCHSLSHHHLTRSCPSGSPSSERLRSRSVFFRSFR